jgi:hypothetical protein
MSKITVGKYISKFYLSSRDFTVLATKKDDAGFFFFRLVFRTLKPKKN